MQITVEIISRFFYLYKKDTDNQTIMLVWYNKLSKVWMIWNFKKIKTILNISNKILSAYIQLFLYHKVGPCFFKDSICRKRIERPTALLFHLNMFCLLDFFKFKYKLFFNEDPVTIITYLRQLSYLTKNLNISKK